MLKNIEGKNNKLIFVLDNGDEITDFTQSEIELLNELRFSIFGDNNVVRIKIKERKDIDYLVNHKGIQFYIFGFNNVVSIGDIRTHVIPRLGVTGLQINIGNPADPYMDTDRVRYANNCNINIGDNTIVCGCRIFLQDDNSSVSIGKDCMFSWGIDVWCTDVHTITDMDGNPQNYGKSIEIGDHVWVGKDVKIGKNTRISDNSIVGWASVVTRKFEETNVIIAGNPAKIIKRDINWNPRDLQSYELYREKRS